MTDPLASSPDDAKSVAQRLRDWSPQNRLLAPDLRIAADLIERQAAQLEEMRLELVASQNEAASWLATAAGHARRVEELTATLAQSVSDHEHADHIFDENEQLRACLEDMYVSHGESSAAFDEAARLLNLHGGAEDAARCSMCGNQRSSGIELCPQCRRDAP